MPFVPLSVLKNNAATVRVQIDKDIIEGVHSIFEHQVTNQGVYNGESNGFEFKVVTK